MGIGAFTLEAIGRLVLLVEGAIELVQQGNWIGKYWTPPAKQAALEGENQNSARINAKILRRMCFRKESPGRKWRGCIMSVRRPSQELWLDIGRTGLSHNETGVRNSETLTSLSLPPWEGIAPRPVSLIIRYAQGRLRDRTSKSMGAKAKTTVPAPLSLLKSQSRGRLIYAPRFLGD